MNVNQLDPRKSLNPAYKKYKPLRKDIESFVTKLEDCIATIKLIDERNESEEHLKSPIKRFLETTFYSENEINTKERIDLAIYLGKDATSDVGVVIEAKRPSNKAEFLSIKNLNKKALHELLLYYLRERVDYKNNNIKQLVITNGYEWFFFKAEDFYNTFYKNKKLVKEYEQFRDKLKDTSKNELFYNEIAYKYIEEVKHTLPFVHLDFRSKSLSELKDKEIIIIYKLFSDVHLLGKSFGNDSNRLNKEFYNELLHIIGLEEVKDNSKKIIQRKGVSQRDYSSLLENTIFTLEDRDYLNRVKYIPNSEEKSFVVGLELCLTWVNRILFLKLLESQLLSYNNNSPAYKFLNFNFIDGFDELNDLFFSALAKPLDERHPKYADKFKYIPYLNSSLFEHSPIESLTFDVTALKDEEMEISSSTVLKDSAGKRLRGKLNTLEYLFKFLDAYDFSTESGLEIEEHHENKTLINASVLGLIFEKINGYKDGSFYTPGLITMFMCKETLQKIVTQKFKDIVNDQIETFEDVRDYCGRFFKKADVLRFNSIINDIKICDPAVGSGHFLVSALNEMIAIKSEIHILADQNGNALPCEIQIENDELYISDANGDLFDYQRNDPISLKIQKSIFHEKQTIIENCLFGVDINSNSVNICRLRLWIELLKNAYYTDEGQLQTLPNIDINIKSGNSLISRFGLNDNLDSAFNNKEVNYTIEEYKQAVKEYKTTNSKIKKREIEEIIATVKNNFKSTLDNKIKDRISKTVGDYQKEEQRLQNLLLFNEKLKKSEKDNLKKLKEKADRTLKEKGDILNNAKYRNAFEWRFEFPETLDDEGNFIGFDAIIGNPPYIQLQKMGADSIALEKIGYETFARTGDIYSLFYELGHRILKNKGLLIFITSNKWMRAAYGESLRKFFVEKTDPIILIDFGGSQIFDTATVDTNILMFSKDKNRQQTQACIIKEKVLNNLSIFFRQNSNVSSFTSSNSWVVLLPIEKQIKDKIQLIGLPLKDWDININYGIKTGFNEAFIITEEERKELIEQDPKSADIIRPILRGRDIKRYAYEFADLWLINSHNGIKEKGIKPIEINDYPAIKKHLDKYHVQLLKRTDKGDSPYNLRNCAYMDDFYKQKIVWIELADKGRFAYDYQDHYITLNGSFIMVGNELEYLCCILNCPIISWLFNTFCISSGVGTNQWRELYVRDLLIPKISNDRKELLLTLFGEVINEKDKTRNMQIQNDINLIIYDALGLTKDEVEFIELQ
jgi:adenine-specific DNA-methyltransferase